MCDAAQAFEFKMSADFAEALHAEEGETEAIAAGEASWPYGKPGLKLQQYWRCAGVGPIAKLRQIWERQQVQPVLWQQKPAMNANPEPMSGGTACRFQEAKRNTCQPVR